MRIYSVSSRRRPAATSASRPACSIKALLAIGLLLAGAGRAAAQGGIAAGGGGGAIAPIILSRDGIGVTSTDGAALTNATPAAVGAQQWSPRLRFTGQGWKTNATAGSQTVDWIVENQPVQEAANPIGRLVFSHQTNSGGGYTAIASLFGNVAGVDVGTTNIAALQLIVGSAGSGSIGPLTGSDHINVTRGGTSGVTIGFGAFTSGADLGQIGIGLNGFGATNPTYSSLSSAYATAFGSGDASGANIAGANTTVFGGRSTGTGSGGSVLVQTSPGGGGGSSANALTTNLTIYPGIPFRVNAAADFTTAANTNLQLITGLSWTFPSTLAASVHFDCYGVYSIATAAAAVDFGVQDVTVAPTNGLLSGSQWIATGSAAPTIGVATGFATTTATSVTTATPGVVGTKYPWELHGFIEQPSNASTSAFQIMVKTAVGADAVTVYRDSYCTIF